MGAGLSALVACSTAFAMKTPDQIDGIFRPTEKEIKSLTTASGAQPSPAEIAADANEAKNRDFYFLAGKAYEFLTDKPDIQKACEYYRKAAELGQPDAAVRMAWYQVQLNDDAKSHEDALKRVSEYSQKNNTLAKVSEACMLAAGFGGAGRVAEGVETLRKMSEAGVSQAEYIMGTFYLEGLLVPKDPAKAFQLLSRAADKGLPGAQLNLGICYSYGIGTPPSPGLAFGWYLKSAENGDMEAEHNIGNAYLKGRGVNEDFEKAAYWLRKSARHGKVESMTALGMALIKDPQTPEQAKEGVALLQQASGLGDPLGRYGLSHLYLEGRLLPFDFQKGLYLLRASADAGVSFAQFDLSRLLQYGTLDGLKPDKIDALKWCLLAAASGFPPAGQLEQELISTMSPDDIDNAKKRAAAFKPSTPAKSREEKVKFRVNVNFQP